MSYAKLIAKEYGKYQPLNFLIDLNGKQLEKSALICAIANASQVGNGFTISPASSMQDQELEMVLIDKVPFINTMASGTRFVTQSINESKYFHSEKFNTEITVKVKTSSPHYFHVDGEPFTGKGEYKIQMKTSNLKIL